MLSHSTDRRCRDGAPVQNFRHSVSYHPWEQNAPSNVWAKRLGLAASRANKTGCPSLLISASLVAGDKETN